MTGTKSVTRANTWKNTSKATGKAVKKLIPHAAKHGKDSSGFNLSYYRKSFFLLDKQTQYDLYMSGFAPKMTKREVSKLRASSRHGHTSTTYKPETVMYDAHISPSGYEAPLKDLVAEAKAAKRRAVATAKKRKQAAAAANGDALPAHPTPAAYTKIQVQRRTKAQQQQQQAQLKQQQQARLKQQQQQQLKLRQQQQQQRLPQTQGGRRQRQSQQIGVAVSHDRQQQGQGLTPAQARVRQSVGGVPVTAGGAGRRVAGQSVAGSSRG